MKIVSKIKHENSKKTMLLKASPSQKENINFTSQKYYSLLKSKRNSGKKRLEKKQLKAKEKNLIVAWNNKGNKSFSKKSSPLSKIENHSFTKMHQINLDKYQKPHHSKTPKIEKKQIEFKNKNCFQKSKKKEKKQKIWFRSPPLPQKNSKKAILNYNSTGKLVFNKSFKLKQDQPKEEKFQPSDFIILTVDNVKVNNYCFDHNKKKSKFYLNQILEVQSQENECIKINQGICSKCANANKKKGIQVFKILSQEEKIRKQKIKNFITILEKEQEFCENNENLLNSKYQELSTNYEKQVEKLNAFFTEIYQQLEDQRNSFAKKLEKNLLKNKNNFEKILDNYSESQNVFIQISKDIQEHYENIIEKVEMEPFNQILNKYTEKLQYFQDMNKKPNFLQFKDQKINLKKKAKDLFPKLNLDIEIKKESQTLKLFQKDQNNLHNLKSESILESGVIEVKNLNTNTKTKSEVYISFDEKFQENQQFEQQKINKEELLSQRYSQILQKINNSQKSKTEFYQNILKNNSSKFDNEIDLQPKNLNESEFQHEEESQQSNQDKLFEINKDDHESWIMKQTPDLGEKVTPPTYLETHLEQIKDNYMKKEINKNINQNLQKQKGSFSCQKTLFQNNQFKFNYFFFQGTNFH